MARNKVEIISEAVRLAERVGNIFVATADNEGRPHVAAAGKLFNSSDKNVLVTEWFCPGTVANLEVNPMVSIVVWDSTADFGFQLNGKMEEMKDIGMLDGYVPGIDEKISLSQIKRQLLVRVNKVIEFKKAPHNDTED